MAAGVPLSERRRANPTDDAESLAVDLLLSMRDMCRDFDAGGTYHFRALAGHLRTFCHDGSGRSLLNAIREKGREFPSSMMRGVTESGTSATDLFCITDGGVLPCPHLSRSDMRRKKLKHWFDRNLSRAAAGQAL